MAVFLDQKGSSLPVYAARFLPHDAEDQRQIGFHRSFYKYCAFLPDSTPTLSPTLQRAVEAIPAKTVEELCVPPLAVSIPNGL